MFKTTPTTKPSPFSILLGMSVWYCLNLHFKYSVAGNHPALHHYNKYYSNHHYTKMVSIVAGIRNSSDLHYTVLVVRFTTLFLLCVV